MRIFLPAKEMVIVWPKSGIRCKVENGNVKISVPEGKIFNYERIIFEIVYGGEFGSKCYICGKTLNRKTQTVDHINPRTLGGISITNNLAPCCQECNNKKSDLPV